MEFIAMCANSFIDLFKAGAQIFTGFVTGIIPLVVVLMTAVNSLIKLIGEQRFYGFARKATKYKLTPVTGLFPHANGGELFVYMGIAAGIQALGYPLGDLAVRYFLIGIVVIFLRGIITERIYIYMNRKAGRKV